MAQEIKQLKVLIASPGDARTARDAVERIIHEWNSSRGDSEGINLRPVRWETDSVALVGFGDGQDVINKQLVDGCDIVIAMFYHKLGSATARAVSGTAEEILRSMARNRPVHLYFSTAPIPQEADFDQWTRLQQFKKQMQAQGLLGFFESDVQLQEQVRRAIELDVASIKKLAPKPGDERPPPKDGVNPLDSRVAPESVPGAFLTRRRRVTMAASFAVVLAIASAVIAQLASGLSAQPTKLSASPINTSLYYSFLLAHSPREQPCVGLLGFCLGQTINVATNSLGTSEAPGSPFPGQTPTGQSVLCHRWLPPDVDSIDVCETAGAISSIRLDYIRAQNELKVAVPGGSIVLAAPARNVVGALNDITGLNPYLSVVSPSEGESILAFSWFLPQSVEGPPENKITVVARQQGLIPDAGKPLVCAGDPYRMDREQVLAIMDESAVVSSVTISGTDSDDLGVLECAQPAVVTST